MRRPEVPAIPIVNGKADSTYPYRFVKEHYWDDVAFNDNSLLHTPFFEPKLDDYYKYYVSPEPVAAYMVHECIRIIFKCIPLFTGVSRPNFRI